MGVFKEYLNEISKKTLGSYINKAVNSAAVSHAADKVARERAHEVDRFTNRNGMVGNEFSHRETIKKMLGADSQTISKHHDKVVKRILGIEKATKRLTK